MFPQISRLMPKSVRVVVFAMAWAFVACLTTVGVSSATTDPFPGPPSNEPVPGLEDAETQLSPRCQQAVDTFFAEIDWILSHPSDHPQMDAHVDKMWRAWEIAEFECGIDVGGDGEIG